MQQQDLARADAEGLAASIHQTSHLSERVSSKVRELDLAQSRVQQTIERIHRLLSRTKAIDGVQQALAVSDYETAAGYVHDYLQLQQELGTEDTAENLQAEELEKVASLFSVGMGITLLDLLTLVQQVQNARTRLLAAVREQLIAASNEKNHSNILRFVKLYAPLGAKVFGYPTLPGSPVVDDKQAVVVNSLMSKLICRRRE